MKLGYILSNIATNLQKNGLCVKEEEEEKETEVIRVFESGSTKVKT